MDKITIFLKYTGTLNFTSCAEATENLISVPDRRECMDYIASIGNIDPEIELNGHVKLWWNLDDRLFKIFWYTTSSEKALSEFTPEKQELFNLHDWNLTINVEHNNYAGVRKECLLNKFEIFNSVPADNFGEKTLDFPDGRYVIHNQTITRWGHDGGIISMTDYELRRRWHNNYRIYMHSPLRFAQFEWSTVLTADDSSEYYYYEISRPTNEAVVSFQQDLDSATIIDDTFIKEFIDQIYFTCPYITKIDGNSVSLDWPSSPITLNSRFRDSKGYYFVLFAVEWDSTYSEWSNIQLNYLKDLLDHTPKYIGDKDAILAYAREKWTIQ
jgi:hypothetical protein